MRPTCLIPLVLLTAITVCCSTAAAGDSTLPEGVRSIGGRWYLKSGERPVYLYRDGDAFVDLFSYHAQDSNHDGIANVRVSHDERFLIVDSQGYPNHPTAQFPNSKNPNSIRVQDFRFRFPLEPQLADQVTRVPMGPIGMAINGVVFFNPFERGGMNAVEGYSEIWLDACCGHPEQRGVYHYHKYPSCVKSPFPDDGKRHSPIIGFAFDGFPLYGPYESDGVFARDLKGSQALDVCNGHSDPERGYHYHVTPGRFPYLIGGYAGVVEPSNNHNLRHAEPGAIVNNAQGQGTEGLEIRNIKPGTVARGETHALQIELNAGSARGLPRGVPSWVQIGPYKGKQIARRGHMITAEFTIPPDATVGVLLDCHLEFATDGDRGEIFVFKKNEALRIAK
jgi:hypothetical protein